MPFHSKPLADKLFKRDKAKGKNSKYSSTKKDTYKSKGKKGR